MTPLVKTLIILGYLIALASSAEAEDGHALQFWVPAAYSKAQSVNQLGPYIQELQTQLQRPVRMQFYNSLGNLRKHCHQGQVDHILIDQNQAIELLGYCELQLLAKASQAIYLYTNRNSGKYRLSEIRSLGLHSLPGGHQMIRDELDPSGKRFSLVDNPSLLSSLRDLLQHRIDGLVMPRGPIAQLDGRIHSKLRILHRFKTSQTLYFMASPLLDEATLTGLVKLYQVKTHTVNQLLDEQFGLSKLSPPEKEDTSPLKENLPAQLQSDQTEVYGDIHLPGKH